MPRKAEVREDLVNSDGRKEGGGGFRHTDGKEQGRWEEPEVSHQAGWVDPIWVVV